MATDTRELEPFQREEQQGLSLADYYEILKRRRWWLIIPALILFAVVAAVAMSLPAVYESRATILIERQEIPTDLVRSTITSYADQRVQVISQRVLNSANLTNIIEKYDLYAEARETASMSSLVEAMRNDITLRMISAEVTDPRTGRPGSATIAFTLAYQSASPRQAQQVVNELISLFLAENTRQRQLAASETSRFLGREADRLAAEVAELEARLAVFKEANMNSLPEMQSLNMTLMQRLEDQLLRNDRDARTLDERVVHLQSQLAQMSPSGHVDRIRALEAQYASLAAIYTERHPDRLKMQRELEALRAEASGTGGGALQNNPLYVQLQTQLQAVLAERRSLLTAGAELQQKIAELEQRLSNTPMIEREYRALTRDYDSSRANFQEIRAKQLEAQLAESLELESQSERLTLVEPALMPQSPTSPNRRALLFMGLVLSVGGGGGMALLRDSVDPAIHGPRSVARATGVPPLAIIPYIQTDAERVRSRFRTITMVTGSVLFLAVALAYMHFAVRPLDILYLQLLDRIGL